MDVGATNLQCPWNLQSLPYTATKVQRATHLQCHWKKQSLPCTDTTNSRVNVYHTTKAHKIKGGNWRYKLTVSTVSWTYAKSTIQKYINSRVDAGVTNSQYGWNLHSLPYTDEKFKGGRNPGWTLALQTYSVLKICNVYHTRIHTFKGGRWRHELAVSMKFATSTIQRYRNTRVDVGVTKLTV